MPAKEKIAEELESSIKEGCDILQLIDNKDRGLESSFELEYQYWYSKTIKVVELLAPERLKEFKGYYEIDTKRKALTIENYVIQDYVKGILPKRESFNIKDITYKNLYNQTCILSSLNSRISLILNNIENSLFYEIQNKELKTAKVLVKINLRAAGALAGVVLEGHLAKICEQHKIIIKKQNPTISDFNENLKTDKIYDTVVWRKVSYLGDLRNLCVHQKNIEPTREQIEELIAGVNWAMKNIN